MDCAILKCWQTPMIGRDMHDTLFPPAFTPPAAPTPYVVFTILPGIPMAAKYSFTVLSSGNGVILRGSDAGSFIPHIGNMVNPLIWVIIPTSGSKSEFGVFSVTMEKQPVACAFPFKYATMNVNCAGPTTSKNPTIAKFTKGVTAPPTLTNLVIAPNTHFVGMRIGDIVASVVQIALDIAIQTAINFGCNMAGSYIANSYAPFVVNVWSSMETPLISALAPRTAAAISNFVGFGLGDFVLGSPVGYSGALPGSDNDRSVLGLVTADDNKGNQGGAINTGLTKGIANPLNNLFYGGESM